MREKFVGALIGTAVGDALGMPVEGYLIEDIKNNFGSVDSMIDGWLPKGHYTDDTQQMIGVAESLIESRGFDGEDMLKRFMNNFEAFRGYGPGVMRVFQKYYNGQSWSEAGKHIYGGGSYGNGAAMRIAPVGILYHSKPDLLIRVAEDSSKLTHTNPLGIEGAVLQAYAVGLAASTDPTLLDQLDRFEFLKLLNDMAELDEYRAKIQQIEELLVDEDGPPREEVISALGTGVQAHKSVPMAIYCFLRHYRSYREAVTYAVNMGGDTDTIGAMTGALAGALHGVSSVPEDWLNDLENKGKGRDYIIELGEKLFEAYRNL
jgi:poly(ADP-ribose) glycohydrolase ARH3